MKQYNVKMGWGKHKNLKQIHYWMANSQSCNVQTLCKFAVSVYWECADADADQEKCPDCFAKLEAAP